MRIGMRGGCLGLAAAAAVLGLGWKALAIDEVDEEQAACRQACQDAAEECMTRCSEHDDTVECDGNCQDDAESCAQSCEE
jgi:hypothetical protein